ncbi:hypothetical protein FAI40_04105 [Acetobacteraceae bacterium]|nr:hypothetical protein FAI40_04105 [Acetobacteraceae bacterium]
MFDFKNGFNTDKSSYGKGYKFANVMDVLNNSIITENIIIGSVTADIKSFDLFSLSFGDVLFNRTSEIPEEIALSAVYSEIPEEIALSAVYMDDKPAMFGGFVIRGRQKTASLAVSFLPFVFEVNKFRKQVFKLAQGAVRSNIGQESLNKVTILLPPLPEQRRIAEVLSTWDRAIETAERLLENSEKRFKALMQQLLTGKKRLPNFRGKWVKKELGDIAQMKSGGTPLSSKSECYGGEIPWVSIKDITSTGKYILETERTLTEKGIENSSAFLYLENTILFAMYASIGECCIAEKSVSSSQAILGISCQKSLYFEFLYYWFLSGKNKFKGMGQKGSQSNLNAGHL